MKINNLLSFLKMEFLPFLIISSSRYVVLASPKGMPGGHGEGEEGKSCARSVGKRRGAWGAECLNRRIFQSSLDGEEWEDVFVVNGVGEEGENKGKGEELWRVDGERGEEGEKVRAFPVVKWGRHFRLFSGGQHVVAVGMMKFY